MKTKLLKVARTIAALVFIGLGADVLFDSIHGAVTRSGSDLGFLWVVIPFTLIVTGVLFASGNFLLRRQYRHFASIWVVLGTFAIFGCVMGIPARIERLFSLGNTDWRVMLLSISSLFGGFYAARWFFRAAFRILDRHLPRDEHNPPAAMA